MNHHNGSTPSLKYDSDNRLTHYGELALSQDADGNLLTAPSAQTDAPPSTITLSYDPRNRLKEADQIQYQYDALGHRTQVNAQGSVQESHF